MFHLTALRSARSDWIVAWSFRLACLRRGIAHAWSNDVPVKRVVCGFHVAHQPAQVTSAKGVVFPTAAPPQPLLVVHLSYEPAASLSCLALVFKLSAAQQLGNLSQASKSIRLKRIGCWNLKIHLEVSWNRGTPKSSHLSRIFHYKPSKCWIAPWKPPLDPWVFDPCPWAWRLAAWQHSPPTVSSAFGSSEVWWSALKSKTKSCNVVKATIMMNN